ncbi:MAG: tetratricopeptide repeat protein, partial [Cyanobacteria bacterium J06626_26]
MKYLSLRQGRRYLRFLTAVCLSFFLTLNVPALAAFKEIHQQPLSQVRQQQTTIGQAASSFLQDGIEFYQAEQFSAAIDAWSRALTGSTDGLQKALLLSNLSLAYQRSGQWEPASESVAQSLLLLKDLADLSESPDYWETVGKALNTQGRLQWTKGDAESALATWRNATAAYHQAGHGRGIVLSLINQAKALQVLGLHRQSATVLKQGVYQFLQSEPIDPPLKATGLWHLGNAQRQFGKLTESQTYLQKSLEIIDAYQLESLRSPVLIDLGNTERALGDSSSAIGKTDEADIHRKSALEAYRAAANSAPVPLTQLQADLNQLSLLIALEQWSEAEGLWPTLLSKLNLPPSRSAIYTELNFAKSLTQLMQLDERQNDEVAAKQTMEAIPTSDEIDSILVKAVHQADELDDAIAKSYALGQRGELYEVTEKWSAAQDFTQKALQLTTTNAYPDGRYRWQWQQGRLLNKQHQRDEAIAAYGAAVETLE